MRVAWDKCMHTLSDLQLQSDWLPGHYKPSSFDYISLQLRRLIAHFVGNLLKVILRSKIVEV